MATKDSGGQERASRSSEEVDEVAPEAATDVHERVEKLGDDVDALLDEIDEGTVEFIPNYDGSTEEPRLLPARRAVARQSAVPAQASRRRRLASR